MSRTVPASLLERFSIARGNTDHPQIINLLVTYPDVNDAPSRQDLTTNIRILLKAFPGLTARVRDWRTRAPYREEQDVEDIQDGVLDPDEEIKADTTAGTIFLQERAKHASLRDITTTGPLWRVGRHMPTSSKGLAYITLDTHHVIVDGAGSGALLELLLTPPAELEAQLTPVIEAEPEFAPRLEDVLDVRPGIMHMLRIVGKELILPQVPCMIRRWISDGRPWPATEEHFGHLEREAAMRLWVIPAETISGAKTVGREHEVATLHPLLHMTTAYAIWAIVTSAKPEMNGSIRLAGGTAMSIRKTNPSFQLTSGNYLGSHAYEMTLDEQTFFWSAIQAYADELGSPAGRAFAIKMIGILGYIPDSASHVSRRPDGRDATGWEAFLMDKASSANPVTDSFYTSNIGRLNKLPSTISDVFFYQRQSPFGPALEVKILGSPNGSVGITLAWVEGGPMNAQLAERFEEVFSKVFAAIATKKIGEETTLAEVRELTEV